MSSGAAAAQQGGTTAGIVEQALFKTRDGKCVWCQGTLGEHATADCPANKRGHY